MVNQFKQREAYEANTYWIFVNSPIPVPIGTIRLKRVPVPEAKNVETKQHQEITENYCILLVLLFRLLNSYSLRAKGRGRIPQAVTE